LVYALGQKFWYLSRCVYRPTWGGYFEQVKEQHNLCSTAESAEQALREKAGSTWDMEKFDK